MRRTCFFMQCVAAVAFALAACDDGVGPSLTDTGTDTGTDVDLDGLEVEDSQLDGEPGCTYDLGEAVPLDQVALLHESGFLIYTAAVAGDIVFPPADLLQLEIWPEHGGTAGTGTWEIVPGSYSDCGLCLLLRQGCEPEDGISRCERDLLALEGTVEITGLGALGELFSGTITGAVLVETTIDWDGGTFESTTVPGGAGACLESLEFEAYIGSYPVR